MCLDHGQWSQFRVEDANLAQIITGEYKGAIVGVGQEADALVMCLLGYSRHSRISSCRVQLLACGQSSQVELTGMLGSGS